MRQEIYIITILFTLLTGCEPDQRTQVPSTKSITGAMQASDQTSEPEHIYGRVLNGLTQTPIKNASVALLGTSISTSTNAQGEYVIRTPKDFGWIRVVADGLMHIERD